MTKRIVTLGLLIILSSLPLFAGQGLRYFYYETIDRSELPDFSYVYPIDEGLVTNFTLTPHQRESDFAFRFTGYIRIDTTGLYTFHVNSDDGSRLLIADTLVVDNDGLHSATEVSGAIQLERGYHSIEVQYFENEINNILEVQYTGPDINKQLIPDSILSVEPYPQVYKTPYAKEVLADQPVSWWRFDEATIAAGESAIDTIGNIDGTYSGNISRSSNAIEGGAAVFTASETGVYLGHELRNHLDGAGGVSYEAWVLNSLPPSLSNTNQAIFINRLASGWSAATLSLIYNDTINSSSNTSLLMGGRSIITDPFHAANAPFETIGVWRHVVGVNDYSANEIRIYLDGQLVHTESAAFANTTYTAGAGQTLEDTIGCVDNASNPNSFVGLIDEVAVYARVLEPQRILAHYEAGNPTNNYASTILLDSPVAYYPFNDDSSYDSDTATNIIGDLNGSFDGRARLVKAGISGSSLRLNGLTGGIDLGHGLRDILDGAEAISVEVWIKNLSLTSSPLRQFQAIFSMRVNDAAAGFSLGLDNDSDGAEYTSTHLQIGGRSNSADSYTILEAPFNMVQQWSHIVGILDFKNDRIRLFINGVEQSSLSHDFNSSTYSPSANVTQTDQIGRSPGLSDGFFDGYIDELAIYNYRLPNNTIIEHYKLGSPQSLTPPWDSEIRYNDAATRGYLGNPAIIDLGDGELLASHDYFGYGRPNLYTGTSALYRSYDYGKNWTNEGDITELNSAGLHHFGDDIYAIGVNTPNHDVIVRRSSDGGRNWTSPSIIFEGNDGQTPPNYGNAPMPSVINNGRIYICFNQRAPFWPWPSSIRIFVMSAEVTSDLSNPTSWTKSNELIFDQDWLDASGFSESEDVGHLEANIILKPDDDLCIISRIQENDPSNFDLNETAVMHTVTETGSGSSYSINIDFEQLINLPGGNGHKFTIRRCPNTGRYLSLVNNNTAPSHTKQRNILSLVSSADLVNWSVDERLMEDNQNLHPIDSINLTGFQYVDWRIDGYDLIYITRTSYEGSSSYHDNNRTTFTRIQNYVRLLPEGDTHPYVEWINNQIPLHLQSNPDYISQRANPDSDPYSIFWEYAFGRSALVPEYDPPLWIVEMKPNPRLCFQRNAYSIDLNYSIESSENLKTWSPIWSSTSAPNTISVIRVGDIDEITIEDNNIDWQKHRFYRVAVTRKSAF